MNAPNVRSATVRLDAEVAAYMAKMKAAGQVTEDAFDRAHASIGRVNDDLKTSDNRLRMYRTRAAQSARDTDRLTTSVQNLSAASKSSQLGLQGVDRDTVTLGRSMDRTGNAIDRTSGRLKLLLQGIAVLGPAAIPIGATGAAGLAGLVGIFTAATVGALGLAAATQGVGDAFEAVEKARLDPTVKNLNAAREAMQGISPEAREFVRELQQTLPLLKAIRDAGAAELFPGLTESLGNFERLEPVLTRFMEQVGEAGGDAIADATESLASDRWRPFLEFLSNEAPDAIRDVTTLVGDLAHGAAELWMAFDPGNDRFVDWALGVADAFDQYASSKQGRADIAAFLAYAQQTGPKVADAFTSIVDAITQIVQAAAPLGGPILDAITGIADALATLADSPVGTPIMATVTAISALSLASAAATGSVTRLSAALGGLGATGAASSLGASASKGGPAGLVLLGVVGQLLNLQDVMEQTKEGTSGFWEGLIRSTIPGIHHLEQLGITIPGITEKTEDASDAARRLAADLEYTRTVTGGGWDTSGMELLYMGLGFTADEARRAAQGMEDFRRSAARAMGILDQQAAMDAFHQSIDDARKSWKEFGENLDATVNSGRQNRAALRGIAESALVAAEGLRGLERVRFLEGAADQIAKWAEKMGWGEQRAERFARRVLGLNDVTGAPTVDLDDKQGRRKVMQMLREMDLLDGTHVHPTADLLIQQFLKGKVSVERMMRFLNGLSANPNVGADVGGAISSINAVESRLRGLNGDTAHTYVYTHFRQTGSGQGQAASPNDSGGVPRADGGTVPGPRYPYADKTLVLAAPGEEIISNRHGEADRFRADRAAGRIPRYADGGTVGADSMVLTRGGNSRADDEVRRETEHRKRLNARLKEATKAVELETRQRDKLVERMDQIRSSMTSALTTELGSDSGDVWSAEAGGTLAGNLAIIQGDTREARRIRRLVEILEEKGFDGAALEDLLSRGDIDEIRSYATGSRRQLRRFEEAFNERARLVRATAREGADAALGDQLRDANDELREANRELRQIKAQVKQANKDRKEEHKKDRDAQDKGAAKARRGRRRD